MRRVFDARLVIAVSLVAALPAAAQMPIARVKLVPADSVAALSWRSLATDATADGLQKRLPDAKELSYAIDMKGDLVWFKVTVNEPVPERWFGINVAVDTDGAPDNGLSWWGTNKIKFDRLATAYLHGAGDDWQGYVGVGDSESIARGYMTNLTSAVQVAVDRTQRTICLGVPRSALGAAPQVRVIATVGSMLVNNDDVPNEGMVTVTLKP